METLYRRNSNGRYERVGATYEPLWPDGLHLVYVQTKPGHRTTITSMNVDLDQVWKKAFVSVNYSELTDLVSEACRLYPAEKLTEEELAQWEAFKQTKAGQKLTKGMYRKSAADIARHILEEMVK